MKVIQFMFLISGLLSIQVGFANSQLHVFGGVDVGRIERGEDLLETKNNAEYQFAKELLQRNYVNVSLNKSISKEAFMSMGVGGVFWKGYENNGGPVSANTFNVGPGISHLYIQQNIFENVTLQYGYFPYKYNQESKNLGEYLFRSEAYPLLLYTGGWSWMNSANYSAVGAKLSWNGLNGRLKQDFMLFIEYFNAPIYDITPAYVLTYKSSSFFTLGMGVSLHRWWTPTEKTKSKRIKEFEYYENITIPPSLNRWRVNHAGGSLESIEVENTLTTESELQQQMFDNTSFVDRLVAGINSPEDIEIQIDTLSVASPEKTVTGLKKDLEEELNSASVDSTTRESHLRTVSFDLKTIKTLLFFNLDLNKLLLDKPEYGKFGIYGEAALLGTKNYPIFYTKYQERLPIMLGLNIPTYILDHLSLEVEYLKNPYVPSLRSVYGELDLIPDEDFREEVFHQDDWKWSVHLGKKITSTLGVYGQVASDHFRPKGGDANPLYVPITNKKDHWYWLLRIQWSL